MKKGRGVRRLSGRGREFPVHQGGNAGFGKRRSRAGDFWGERKKNPPVGGAAGQGKGVKHKKRRFLLVEGYGEWGVNRDVSFEGKSTVVVREKRKRSFRRPAWKEAASCKKVC